MVCFLEFSTGISQFETPIATGILEGYQTFDAIGAVVVGAVIIISLNFKNMAVEAYSSKRTLIRKSGFIAGLGLFIIYAGLISVGAYFGSELSINAELSSDMQRANLLRDIILKVYLMILKWFTLLQQFWRVVLECL